MNRKETVLPWGGLLLWIVATPSTMAIACFSLALLYVTGWVPHFTELPLVLQMVLCVIGGLFLGSIAGAIQSKALTGRVKWGWNWFSGTAVGWGIAGGLWWVLYFLLGGDSFHIDLDTVPAMLFYFGSVTGVVIGSSQLLIALRPGTLSSWWIAISGVSWALGAPAGYAVSISMDFGILTYLILILVTGMLVDLITGTALRASIVQFRPATPDA